MRISGTRIISNLGHSFVQTNKPFQFRLHCLNSISRCDNPLSVAAALSVAEISKSSLFGAQIHANIVRYGLVGDVFSLNNLIKMYSKCGVFHNGLQVFDEVPHRNLVSWTLMVSGSVHNGDHHLGLCFFTEMMRSGLSPNSFGLGSVLKGCADVGAYRFGMSVHGYALKVGIDEDLFVGGSVLNMYAKFEDIRSAKAVFESLPDLDMGCWNAMIGGLVNCGCGLEALAVARSMLRRGASMDCFTLVHSLKGCSEEGDLDFGEQLHGLTVKRGAESSSASVMNCLVDMYFRLGRTDSALKVFDGIVYKDVISWNTVFSHLFVEGIARLFREFMLGGVTPNHITFSVVFRECGNAYDLNLGTQFYSLTMKSGLHDEVTVSNSIIYMLYRCKDMEKAQRLFNTLCFKDITTWNQLIFGYCLNDCHVEGLCVFVNLRGSGVKPNEYTFAGVLEACFESQNRHVFTGTHGSITKYGFSSRGHLCSLLINGYVKFGLLRDSYRFFDGFDGLDFVSWATMISALAREGHICEAMRYLNGLMGAGGKPDEFIFGSILNYCASVSGHRLTRVIHSLVFKTGLETHVFVASGLIDAYAKSGDINAAKRVYDRSMQSNDVVIFNAMIMGYAHHGLVMEAVETIETMKRANLRPNQATFVSVISACSHIGLVDEGRVLFESIISDRETGVSRDVYGSTVDMFSRNGRLEKARQIIEEMPYAPWPAILRSFLNGCRIHGNRELGEWSAKKLVQLAPENGEAAYVLLSKIYSEIGGWADVGKIRRGGIGKGFSKDAGYSWIEL